MTLTRPDPHAPFMQRAADDSRPTSCGDTYPGDPVSMTSKYTVCVSTWPFRLALTTILCAPGAVRVPTFQDQETLPVVSASLLPSPAAVLGPDP